MSTVRVPSMTSSSTTTTTTTASSSSLQSLKTKYIAEIKAAYSDAIGRSMPNSLVRDVERDLDTGTPGYYYLYALEQTAMAPRPSWHYTMAIIRRLYREGLDYMAYMNM